MKPHRPRAANPEKPLPPVAARSCIACPGVPSEKLNETGQKILLPSEISVSYAAHNPYDGITACLLLQIALLAAAIELLVFRFLPPMIRDSEFALLMDKVRAGSVESTWELIYRYGAHIRRVVRRTLDPRLRVEFDSEDFVQSMWGSFFRDPSALVSMQSPADLVRYLTAIARNKVRGQYQRNFETGKRDRRRLQSLSGENGQHLEPFSKEPSGLEVAVARERWDRLFASQPAHYQQIVRLRLMGNTFVEIAAKLNLSERTVRRVVDRLAIIDGS